jgi:hypothetical protein
LPSAVSTSSRSCTVELNSEPRNTAEPTDQGPQRIEQHKGAQRRAHHTGQRTGNGGKARHELGHQQGLGAPASIDGLGLAYAGIGRERNAADTSQHPVPIGPASVVPEHIGHQRCGHRNHGEPAQTCQAAPSSAPVTTSTG